MYKHIVMWKVKEGEKLEDVVETFKAGMKEIAELCPAARDYRIAINIKTSQDYDFCIDSVFADEDAFNEYYYLPRHQEMIKYLTSISCLKTVFDYEF